MMSLVRAFLDGFAGRTQHAEEPPPAPEPEERKFTLIWCARCSARAYHDSVRGLAGWVYDDPLVVLQGKAVGICPDCIGRSFPSLYEEEGEDDLCRGDCSGEVARGTDHYYLAVYGDEGDEWSCTSITCVANWASQQPKFCDDCGSYTITEIYEVTGKKHKLVPRTEIDNLIKREEEAHV